MIKARALLVLGRVSNLSTVWSNCLCAWLLAGGAPDAALLGVIVGMSLLYVGGMYLNDYCDAGFDAKHRPERPIPAGEVSRSTVLLATLGFFVGGFIPIAWQGTSEAWGTLALIGLIVAYNLAHKKTRLGIPLMGACRFAVYWVAGLAASGEVVSSVLWAGGLMFLYVVGITSLARTESTLEANSLLGLAMLASPILAGIGWLEGEFDGVAAFSIAVCGGWVVWVFFKARATGKLIVGKMIGPLLAGICLVDWMILSSWLSHSWVASGMFLAFFLVALVAQRRIPAT